MAAPLADGQKHCPKHDIVYGRLEQCSECRAARSITVRAESPKADLKEQRLVADEYRAEDKYLRRQAREWLTDGTSRDRRDALEAIKVAARCAEVFRSIDSYVKEIEHDQWLREQKRLMGGGGGN